MALKTQGARALTAALIAVPLVAFFATEVGAQNGRTLQEPAASGGSQATLVLVIAGALAIVAGLIALTVVSNRKREAAIVIEPTEAELRSAKTALHGSRTMDALCAEAAYHAEHLVGAEGAVVVLDDIEARSGKPITVGADLMTRVHREKRLVKLKRISAVPVVHQDEVVGLIAVSGGHTETLSALRRFVSGGYAARKKPSRLQELTGDIDGLTGVGNRRRFDADLHDVAEESDEETPVSLAMFDIDNFRFYNDAHGKQAGNEVLRSIAGLIAESLRETDVVYRYSGVKFVALLPGATVENAAVVVERIRKAVEATRFEGEEVQPLGRVTMSVGVAEAPADESTTLLDAADQALNAAKASGRNKVVIEGDIS